MIRRHHVLAHGAQDEATVHVGSTIAGVDKDVFVVVSTVGAAGALAGYLASGSLFVAAIAAVAAVVIVPVVLVVFSGPGS